MQMHPAHTLTLHPPAPCRVMKVGGRYLCVSLAQDHVLECLMDNFKEGWLVRVHVVAIEISEEVGLGGELPVFVFVMTKMATIPGKPAVKVSVCECIALCVHVLLSCYAAEYAEYHNTIYL